MCSFASHSAIEFSQALGRFAIATAGLIAPRPGRVHFNLSASRDACLRQPPGVASGPPAGSEAGDRPTAAGRERGAP